MTAPRFTIAMCMMVALATSNAYARTYRENQADEQFSLGRYALARALYQEALRLEPESEALWAKYDLAYLRELGDGPASGPRRTQDKREVSPVGWSTKPEKRSRTGQELAARADSRRESLAKLRAPRNGPGRAEHKLAMVPQSGRRALSPLDVARPAAALGAPVASDAGQLAALQGRHAAHAAPARRLKRDRSSAERAPHDEATEPAFDRETPPVSEELPRSSEPVIPRAPEAAPAAPQQAAPEPEPQPAQPTSAEAATQAPGPVVTQPIALGPSELVPVPALGAGDGPTPSVGPLGQPFIVKGGGYDIWDLKYGVDVAGRPHITGRLRNLSGRDMVNPQIFVGLVDAAGVQVAFKPVKLLDVAGFLGNGESGEFDAEFPTLTSAIAGYRMFMMGR